MDDLFAMRFVQCARNLSGIGQDLFERQRTRERLPLDVLHDEKGHTVFVTDVVEPADMWMFERRRCASFVLNWGVNSCLEIFSATMRSSRVSRAL